LIIYNLPSNLEVIDIDVLRVLMIAIDKLVDNALTRENTIIAV